MPLDAGPPARAGSPSVVGGGAAVSSGEKEAASAAIRASLRSKTSAEELTDGGLTSCSGAQAVKVDPGAPVTTRRRKAARPVTERKKKVELHWRLDLLTSSFPFSRERSQFWEHPRDPKH